MHASEFTHPEDAAALRQMESIPGFSLVVKKIMSIGYESLQYGINMASNIRLSETQLPEFYRYLPPICKKLDIPVPEFYLKMDPEPNAWTSGDTRIWITMTSSLVDLLTEEELISVLAHECGHIKCRHVLYHTVGQWITNGIANLGFLGTLAEPVRFALLYWYRKSELSADRAAAIVTSPEMVANVQARLAGGPAEMTKNIKLEEWIKQADRYDEIKNDGMWNKTLQTVAIAAQTHPFSAVRVREILKWGASDQYRNLVNELKQLEERDKNAKHCPQCGVVVDPNWKFCQKCGFNFG